nr:hypothetical protein [uncultured Treponema sp.]
MEFDKSRVYTAVNAEDLPIGSRCIFADTLGALSAKVKSKEYRDFIISLKRIYNDGSYDRFDNGYDLFCFAYLIEPPTKPKYRPFESVEKAMEAIWKHDRWIRDTSHDIFLVSGYCSDFIEVSDHLCDNWKSLSDLFHCYVFADDGSPCGELVEE